MYAIRWDVEVRDDMRLHEAPRYEVAQIVDAVDQQLTHEPNRTSKHRKIIRPEEHLPFEHLEPVWQLRVGEYRIFYDVAAHEGESQASRSPASDGVVSIRAVRHKPGHKTTRDIL